MSSLSFRRLLIWGVLGLPLVALRTASGGAAPPAFQRDVLPLLTRRCIACHGAAKQESGLRLDLRARALEGGDSGPAIVPGKSAESELLRRLLSPDPKKRMPPGPSPLPAAEIQTFRAWIDAGAEWPAEGPRGASTPVHWAFRPITRPPLPLVRRRDWVRNPIDAFVLARLEKAGIRPSPEADRSTLLRRASLDLIGLQPTPQELEAYLSDPSATAYEKAVDRLLASPRFGEKWARFWLDQARYADSNGYTIDSARSIWRYRDWVIQALNRDLPFDRFTIEQFAADLLPNAAPESIVATGFHRNTLFNEEGGTDREQFRVESVVDRVNTTGTVFLGLSVGCAQCHSHKYDPITQREYYQLLAFLNNQDEPTLAFPTPEQSARHAELKQSLAVAQARLREVEKSAPARQNEWQVRALAGGVDPWQPARLELVKSSEMTELPVEADQSYFAGATNLKGQETLTLTLQPQPGPVAAIRLEALTDPRISGGGPGLTPHGNFVLSELQVRTEDEGTLRGVPLVSAVADYHQNGMPAGDAIDGNPATGWGVYARPGHQKRTAVFVFREPVEIRSTTRLVVSLTHAHKDPGYIIGRGRIMVSATPNVSLTGGTDRALMEVLRKPEPDRTPADRKRIQDSFQASDQLLIAARGEVDRLAAAEKKLASEFSTTLVLKERPAPRDTYVHIRGDFLRKGAQVQPGVPACLPPVPPDVRSPNRLDFARWLVGPANPLTPRVTVNRIWQQFFGTGIVETENDFGRQGTPPSHPELLDWVSDAFRSPRAGTGDGLEWSLKGLMRLIVLSNTYRQSARHRPELASVDPNNRLLARQNRLRLDAELVRDVSLRASGLLSDKIGGPSVFPPQPGGLDAFTQNRKNWKVSEGEDRYRRGLYTFAWRSSPYALFATLDAPNGNLSCTRRARSNTPLGALMLANDGTLFEMAQALSGRLLREVPAGQPDPDRIRAGYRLCVSRDPTPDEATVLLGFLSRERETFRSSPEQAKQVAPPGSADAAEAAAWTSLARVLLNLDEFISRE